VILLHFLSFTVCNMSLSISLLVFNVHCESKKHATVVLYLPIFNNSVTVWLCNKFAVRSLSYFPQYLEHVTTLPGKTSAAEMLDFQQVTDGVHGHVQVGENGSDICRSWGWDQWHMLPWCAADCAATAQDFWWVLVLERQWYCTPITWTIAFLEWETHFNFNRPVAPSSPDLNPVDYRIWQEVQQLYLSSCHWYTEAAYAMSDTWLGAKHDRWCNKWVAQTFLCTRA